MSGPHDRSECPAEAPCRFVRRLTIAGTDFTIRSSLVLSDEFDDPAYRSFMTAPAGASVPAVDVAVETGVMPAVESFERVFDCGETWTLWREGACRWIVSHPPSLPSPLWAARCSPDFTQVAVISGEAPRRGADDRLEIFNPVHYPLDQLLMMYFLAVNRGTLIHAAGASIAGRGYLFAGRSGAGKSTFSRLLAGGDVPCDLLSDDRMAIRLLPGGFRIFGTPWPGDAGIAANRDAPLAAALDETLRVVSLPWYDPEVMSGALASCLNGLVTRVPAYAFYFTPTPAAVAHLKSWLASKPPLSEAGQ